MVKILDVDVEKDKETMQEAYSFFSFLFSQYPLDSFVLYVVAISETEKGYLFRQQEHCMFYIPSKNKAIPFEVDKEGALTAVFYNGWEINYKCSTIKKGNLELSLSICFKEHPDLYNGEVTFAQKNLATEEICQICYDHMCYERLKSPIYPYHTKEKMFVLFQQGAYYTAYIPREIEVDSPLYSYIRATAHISEEVTQNFVRFYPQISVLGRKYTFPLFQRGMSVEEMDNFILSKGFLSEIPSFLFDVYNERDVFLKMISEICLLMKEVNDKKEDTKRFLITKNK